MSRIGIDPLFWVHWKLFIRDIVNLQPSEYSDVWKYQTHYLRRVQVMGIIVSAHHKTNHSEYIVDDGTGLLPCVEWISSYPNNNNKEESQINKMINTQKNSEDENMEEDEDEEAEAEEIPEQEHQNEKEKERTYIPPGALVDGYGRLSEYRNKIQLTLDSMVVMTDPNQEPLRWLQIMDLKRSVYNVPFADRPERLIGRDEFRKQLFLYLFENGISCFNFALLKDDKILRKKASPFLIGEFLTSDPFSELCQTALHQLTTEHLLTPMPRGFYKLISQKIE